ncbi:MAG: glycosyltransferase family 1 protein, partial [Dehalococcoidia bacterium]|nr:glycosyltransferase family 1 protein [Dehalococcoidia bacterium]
TSHISNLSRELIRAGHQVKILAPSSVPSDALLPDEVIPLGRPVPVPSGGSVARLSLSLWLLPKVRALLRWEQFDIIHLHEPLAPFLPLLVLRESSSVNVGTFHAFHGNTRMYFTSQRFLRPSFQRLHGRIAVSPPALQYASKYFPAEYRIIPNGIDVARFASGVTPLPEFQDGKVNILFVGRLEKRKGLKYLLGAFGRLKWDHPDVRLIVVGPGNLDRDSHRILGERNLKDVVFVGGVSPEQLPRYYRTADICCFPATGKESFGIVLLEAMASGKPVVASNIDGYNGLVTQGVDGWLVKRKDEVALAEALARLVKSPDLRQEMGRRGVVKAQGYRWEHVAGQVMDYYQEILAARGRVPALAGTQPTHPLA